MIIEVRERDCACPLLGGACFSDYAGEEDFFAEVAKAQHRLQAENKGVLTDG